MSALIFALFPFVPPPPADWTHVAVVPNPLLPVPWVAPQPTAAGTVTARSGGWVRVDWGTDSRWVPTALLLTTEQAYAVAACWHVGTTRAGFAWYRAAELAAERGDTAALCHLFDRTLLATPGWSLPMYGRAAARAAAGNDAGAARDAAAYAARRPGEPDGHRKLVAALLAVGATTDAAAAADRAAAALPADPAVVRLTVWARAAAGDHVTAAAVAARMLARFPDHPEAYLARGHQRLAAGQLDAGAADVAAALDLDPAAAVRLCEVTEWLGNRGRYAEGIACADALLARHPGHLSMRNARGLMRFYREEYAQAEDDLTRVLAADPGHADARAARAYCRLNRQQYEGAVADLLAVADREPANDLLRQAVGRLPEVVAYVKTTDPARARRLAADVDRLTAQLAAPGVVPAAHREGR